MMLEALRQAPLRRGIVRAGLAAIYNESALPYLGVRADGSRTGPTNPVRDSAVYLSEVLHRVPVHVVPCVLRRPEADDPAGTASIYGSIVPAAWSFMLALRERGIGSAWTTLHLINGGEQRTAELLGIPFDRYRQAGLFPIAYTQGTNFKPASRLPASQLVHWDAW